MKRVLPWKEVIGLVSLMWSVFRFWWEHGHSKP